MTLRMDHPSTRRGAGGEGENPIVRTERLTKYYGEQVGIDDVSIEVEPGEVFGFLGPNGAGKTTAIRLLLDLIRPTSGRAEVLGLDAQRHSLEVRRRTGYLPGELTLYSNMTGGELLRHFAALRPGVDWRLVNELAERLSSDLERPIGTLSQGNKRKVGLIQAFMHRPELLILDEPTAGLDPLIQHEFLRLIVEASQQGQTVFLSSHNLTEVERVCHRVGMIRGGRLIAVENIADLKARALRRLEIRFAEPVPAAEFESLPGIQDASVDGEVVRCTVTGPLDAVIKAAARFEVVDLISQEPNLEEIFMALYSGNEGRVASPT
jgi:ABC-2 type transport system ATP-binding protein